MEQTQLDPQEQGGQPGAETPMPIIPGNTGHDTQAQEQEIKDALSADPDHVPLEAALDPGDSPLNAPVAENDIGLGGGTAEAHPPEAPLPNAPIPEHDISSNPKDWGTSKEAPEQQIGQPSTEAPNPPPQGLPKDWYMRQADSFLGTYDGLFALGAGWAVKIKKDADIMEFDFVVEHIDTLNAKSVQHILLTETEKALLRPQLALVLQRMNKQLSPEAMLAQSTIMVLLSQLSRMAESRREMAVHAEMIRSEIRAMKDEMKDGKAAPKEAPAPEEPDEPAEAQPQVDDTPEPPAEVPAAEAMPTAPPFAPPHPPILEVAQDEPENPTP